MRRDSATFNGSNTWADLKRQGEKFLIPTKEEVRHQIADAATTAASLTAIEHAP